MHTRDTKLRHGSSCGKYLPSLLTTSDCHQRVSVLDRLEKMLLQYYRCWQGVSNNYETDLLRPIMDRAAELAGISYDTADEKSRTSLKVRGLPALKPLQATITRS